MVGGVLSRSSNLKEEGSFVREAVVIFGYGGRKNGYVCFQVIVC